MKWFIVTVLLLISGVSFSQNTTPRKTDYTVYVFLGENCPICQFHTLTLNNLYKKYNSKGVEFIGVFPNPESDSASIAVFEKEYQIPFELKKDNGRALMKKFAATITPQVFLVANDSVYYKGRINDAFETLGIKKSVIKSPDLENAIKAVLENKPITIKETEAIGCFIDSDY